MYIIGISLGKSISIYPNFYMQSYFLIAILSKKIILFWPGYVFVLEFNECYSTVLFYWFKEKLHLWEEIKKRTICGFRLSDLYMKWFDFTLGLVWWMDLFSAKDLFNTFSMIWIRIYTLCIDWWMDLLSVILHGSVVNFWILDVTIVLNFL